MYNIVEYIINYLKTSERLSQCYRDEPALDSNGNFVNFAGTSFNSKVKVTGNILADDNTKILK